MRLTPEPITPEAFAPFGRLVAAAGPSRRVNLGSADRFDRVAELLNLRPGGATPNLALFRCEAGRLPLTLPLLERHPWSTQVFVPMAPTPYLVVVEAGDGALRAFVARGVGIAYAPGVWHAPLAALDVPLELAMLAFEDGTAGDAETRALDPPALIGA